MHAHDLQLVRDPTRTPPRQGSATVLAIDEHGFVLDEHGVELRAKRAASCLLDPASGDTVWFVVEAAASEAWVIAVLEREAGETPATLSIDGDAQLRARGGKLTVEGDHGVELRTRASVTVNADELSIRARLGRALLDEGSVILRSLFTHADKSTLVGKVIETLAERVTVFSKTSLRSIEELDQIQAGAIDYRAQTSAQIGAEHTLITGAELAKVDGGQIHLG